MIKHEWQNGSLAEDGGEVKEHSHLAWRNREEDEKIIENLQKLYDSLPDGYEKELVKEQLEAMLFFERL